MHAQSTQLVLTVNGKAEIVVQDAESYQRMLELLDRAETVEALREGNGQSGPDRASCRVTRPGASL